MTLISSRVVSCVMLDIISGWCGADEKVSTSVAILELCRRRLTSGMLIHLKAPSRLDNNNTETKLAQIS